MVTTMSAPTELYNGYVDLIRAGCMPFESKARAIAKTHRLPLGPLELALGEAYARLMTLYLTEIESGRTSYAARAYELARERNFPSQPIEDALRHASRAAG